MKKLRRNDILAGILFVCTMLAVVGCSGKSYQEVTEAAAQTQPLKPEVEISILPMETTRETAPSQTEVSFSAVDETVYVTSKENGSVNLRSSCKMGPSYTDNIMATLPVGTVLRRIGTEAQWSKVVYKEETGYIATQFLSLEKPEGVVVEEPVSSAVAGEVKLNASWKYAEYSKINSGAAVMYRSSASQRKGITVCVNAGHGTKGGSSVKTQCHPDGTPKVTGGTTNAGATSAVAVSSGMEFNDGTPEANVTLAMALVLKDKLLARGYDVLMIRETKDVQLDNIARTVMANNLADCHIAIHWDSSTTNKGAFYMSVPNVASYRNMEPVKSNWEKHNALGASLVGGLKGAGVKIWSGGALEMDLTQTSYSTVPSIDIELGDKASDHSAGTLDNLGTGLADGVDAYFKGKSQ